MSTGSSQVGAVLSPPCYYISYHDLSYVFCVHRLDSTSEVQEEEKKESVSQDDSEKMTVEPISHLISYRVPSKDLSEVNHNLDHWHQRHSHVVCGEEEERHNKTRYSNRRSLEEVWICHYGLMPFSNLSWFM